VNRFKGFGKKEAHRTDVSMVARLGWGNKTPMARYEVGGGRFRVWEVAVRWCGPRGHGSWIGGCLKTTLDSEARGGCNYGALETHHGGATARSSSGRLLAMTLLSLKKAHSHGRMLALGRELARGSQCSGGLRCGVRGIVKHGACLHVEGKLKSDLASTIRRW
jgi:hypothetical protein